MFIYGLLVKLLLCMLAGTNAVCCSSNWTCLGRKDCGSVCIAVDTSLSEYRDVDEKGILKDVRTSYVPQEPTYMSFNGGQRHCIPSVIKHNAQRYSRSPLTRWIRSIVANASFSDNDLKEAGELVSTKEEAANGFHSFWKGGGSPEEIRSIQANIMKSYMDMTTDPCTDFYQFACGNWAKLNPIPKDKAGYDTFEMLRENLDIALRDLLTEENSQHFADETTPKVNEKFIAPSLHQVNEFKKNFKLQNIGGVSNYDHRLLTAGNRRFHTPDLFRRYRRNRRLSVSLQSDQLEDAEQKAKDLYASCMDTKELEKRGLKPLLELLNVLGGWPVIEKQWDERTFSWLTLVAQLRRYNNDVLIVEWVGPDVKNSDENIIQFDQTSLGLPTRDYFLQESNTIYLEAYRSFMESIMHLTGASKEIAKNTAEEVIQFETELAKITSSSEDRANVSVLYKRMTLRELHHLVPEIDWNKYLTIVQERTVKDSEDVVIYALEYMQSLVILLSKTKPRIIANYLIWRFVRHRINNLDDRFQLAKQNFFHVLFGREQSPPRWKTCVGQVNSNMGMALGAMFVRKHFDENSKQDTLKMTRELQQAFREILNYTEWLDEITKHLAELKVNSMSLKIGYPNFILSKSDLNAKYKGLNVERKSYFENTLNVLWHVARTEQNKLSETVNKTVWQTAPAIVNAYYSRNKNQIMFPAGILQPPFYHRYFPKCLNYGGIGVVIGHELTHGFDDKGRLFDRNGNIHKWWSDYSINGFHERARCLISQYGNYTVSEVGIPIDGESTQGENIADNGGIRQAFRAYKNWLQKNTTREAVEMEALPGLNLTCNQMFFLNFAQVWCGAMRPEATRSKLKTAVHSPGKFRVIGTLSNSIDFAREFQCPRGSPMNPLHKCSVW